MRLKRDVLFKIIHEVTTDFFGKDCELEIGYADPNKVTYVIYVYSKSELEYFSLTYRVGSTGIEIELFNLGENFTKTIEFPKVSKGFERELREDLEYVLDIVLRRIKLKRYVREFIKQKLARDAQPVIVYDDGYNARLKMDIGLPFELLISYKWDKSKKVVSDMNIISIEIYTVDEKIEELIFNAILSYYLLS